MIVKLDRYINIPNRQYKLNSQPEGFVRGRISKK
jgi:hypothetical protein